MVKRVVLLLVTWICAYHANSQCTSPNTPLATSLILNATDTQLAVYYDTTSNVPATNIYYLGILFLFYY